MGVSKNIESLTIRVAEHLVRLCDLATLRYIRGTQRREGARTQRMKSPFFWHLLKTTESIRIRKFWSLPLEIPKTQNIPANERSMAGFAPVLLLTAGLVISLREKSAGEGILSAGGVVTTPESISTAEGKSKETRVEPVDLEDITMIGQLTIKEGVASNATVPNDRVISREGKCIPQFDIHRHRRPNDADVYEGSDSGRKIYHRRYASQNRDGGAAEGWCRSGRGIESGSGLSDWGT